MPSAPIRLGAPRRLWFEALAFAFFSIVSFVYAVRGLKEEG